MYPLPSLSYTMARPFICLSFRKLFPISDLLPLPNKNLKLPNGLNLVFPSSSSEYSSKGLVDSYWIWLVDCLSLHTKRWSAIRLRGYGCWQILHSSSLWRQVLGWVSSYSKVCIYPQKVQGILYSYSLLGWLNILCRFLPLTADRVGSISTFGDSHAYLV